MIVALAHKAQVPIVPVSLQYIYREHAQPSAVVYFSKAISFDHPNLLTHLSDTLVDGLKHCDRIIEHNHGFEAFVPPQKTRSETGLGTRLLSLFTRPALGEKDA